MFRRVILRISDILSQLFLSLIIHLDYKTMKYSYFLLLSIFYLNIVSTRAEIRINAYLPNIIEEFRAFASVY